MSRLLPSYLNTLRMQWGLSQPELAELLGIDPTLLSKLEALSRRPTARVVLAAEIVFGLPARDIFPGAYSDMAGGVMHRARALREQLAHQSGPAAAEKRRLLKDMVKRIGGSKKGL